MKGSSRPLGFFLGALLLLTVTGGAMLMLDLRPVKRVTLVGALTPEQRQDLGQALAGLQARPRQVAAIQAAIEALPWVGEVAVGKDWPFGLRVQVAPAAVIARWNQGAFISEKVEVLATALLDGAGLPRLQGPPGAELEVVQAYQQFARTLAPSRHRIATLALSARGAWEFTTRDGIKVHLGREDARRRLERFLRVCQSLDRQGLAYSRVDARYPTGLAVQLRPPPPGRALAALNLTETAEGLKP